MLSAKYYVYSVWFRVFLGNLRNADIWSKEFFGSFTWAVLYILKFGVQMVILSAFFPLSGVWNTRLRILLSRDYFFISRKIWYIFEDFSSNLCFETFFMIDNEENIDLPSTDLKFSGLFFSLFSHGS